MLPDIAFLVDFLLIFFVFELTTLLYLLISLLSTFSFLSISFSFFILRFPPCIPMQKNERVFLCIYIYRFGLLYCLQNEPVLIIIVYDTLWIYVCTVHACTLKYCCTFHSLQCSTWFSLKNLQTFYRIVGPADYSLRITVAILRFCDEQPETPAFAQNGLLESNYITTMPGFLSYTHISCPVVIKV